MASSIPSQERVVDPFASYNSNIVNRLTEIVSQGQNCLVSTTDLQVTINDSTSVLVSDGYAIQDDVVVHITSQHKVDFYDINHYTNNDPYPTPGYNYVVLDYGYVKSRPAPTASIKILRESERTVLASSSNLQLLKVVKLSTTGPHIIESLHDYDPQNTSNQRTTANTYGTLEGQLPTFSRSRDESRIAYVSGSQAFYGGLSNRWVPLGSDITIIKDTSSLSQGDLVYIDATGTPQKALSKFPLSTSDGVVTVVGTPTSSPPGQIQVTGKVDNVPVETTVAGSINVGDLLYLSISQAGKATNIEDYPFSQFIGRCLEVIDSTTVDMLYVRGFVSPSEASANLAAGIGGIELAAGSWVSALDGTSVVYYQDIDISGISGRDAIIVARDLSDNEIIEPYNINFISNSTARLYMTDSTTDLAITVIGPAISIGVNNVNTIRQTLNAGSWTLQGGSYYQDVNITSIGSKDVAVGVRDQADDMKIIPSVIDLDNTGVVRIWMPDNTHTVTTTIVGAASTTELISSVISTINPADWTSSGGRYYYDISTSIINNQDVLVSARDDSTDELIRLADVEFVDSDTVRVWMPVNTKTIHVIVVG